MRQSQGVAQAQVLPLTYIAAPITFSNWFFDKESHYLVPAGPKLWAFLSWFAKNHTQFPKHLLIWNFRDAYIFTNTWLFSKASINEKRET